MFIYSPGRALTCRAIMLKVKKERLTCLSWVVYGRCNYITVILFFMKTTYNKLVHQQRFCSWMCVSWLDPLNFILKGMGHFRCGHWKDSLAKVKGEDEMNQRLQVDYIEARELFTKGGIDHSGKRWFSW